MKKVSIAMFLVAIAIFGWTSLVQAEIKYRISHIGNKTIIDFTVPTDMMLDVDGYKISTMTMDCFVPAGERLILPADEPYNFSVSESFLTDRGWVFRDSAWIVLNNGAPGSGEFDLDDMPDGVYYSWLWAPNVIIKTKGKTKYIEVKIPFQGPPIHVDEIEVVFFKGKRIRIDVSLPPEGGKIIFPRCFDRVRASSIIWDDLNQREIIATITVNLK